MQHDGVNDRAIEIATNPRVALPLRTAAASHARGDLRNKACTHAEAIAAAQSGNVTGCAYPMRGGSPITRISCSYRIAPDGMRAHNGRSCDGTKREPPHGSRQAATPNGEPVRISHVHRHTHRSSGIDAAAAHADSGRTFRPALHRFGPRQIHLITEEANP